MSHFIAADGTKIACDDQGDGVPLLCLFRAEADDAGFRQCPTIGP